VEQGDRVAEEGAVERERPLLAEGGGEARLHLAPLRRAREEHEDRARGCVLHADIIASPAGYNRAMIPAPKTAGVLLAGGQSRRMGREKPLQTVGGLPLVERAAKAMAACVDELLLVTNRPDLYDFLRLPIVEDVIPGRGPLGGLHAAHQRLKDTRALVVASDAFTQEVKKVKLFGLTLSTAQPAALHASVLERRAGLAKTQGASVVLEASLRSAAHAWDTYGLRFKIGKR